MATVVKLEKIEKIVAAARDIGFALYRTESNDAKYNAQRNLNGRTHYVEDSTLRYHKGRILATRHDLGGLVFCLIESCAADMNNTHRVFRPVVFSITGTVISRIDLENSFKTCKAARKAMYAICDDEKELLSLVKKDLQSRARYAKRELVALEKTIKLM